MPRDTYHDKDGGWQACTPLEDLKYCLPFIIIFLAECFVGWLVWHYCKVHGYL